MSILDHVDPRFELRDVQRSILLQVEEAWKDYDYIVIDAPVASGKSLIANTIARWQKDAAILTPKTNLQDQYQIDFPYIPSLKGRGRYSCKTRGVKSCGEFYDLADTLCCKQCPYSRALKDTRESDIAIYNFHSNFFQGVVSGNYKSTLIVDEAHNLISTLIDMYVARIWKFKKNYPSDIDKYSLVIWFEEESKKLLKEIGTIKKLWKGEGKLPTATKKELNALTKEYALYNRVKKALMESEDEYAIEEVKREYRGKLEECLEIRPFSLRGINHAMWPKGKVNKVVMLSATIYKEDLSRLGVPDNHLKIIRCKSPIPADNRPIIISSAKRFLNKSNTEEMIPSICKDIQDIANHYNGKGIVHLTYGLVYEFKKYLKGNRFIWHTKHTRDDAYKEFLESSDNVILMACGMSEGIDLAGKDFMWQAIAKIPYPSLGDPFIKKMLAKNPILYTLDTIRTVVQQSGRICRTPTDYGATYILDGSFYKLFFGKTRNVKNYERFPSYFKDAIKWEGA